jgi:Na+/H+ antiporter NhaD/arsenite permease-like protein
MSDFALATLIFILVYVLIIVEKWHKTVVAIGGAAAVLIFKILTHNEAFRTEEFGVDWNVIVLLVSMMIIINIMRETGIFQWTAIKTAKLGRGEPFSILILLCIVTAVLSALLDNVTTVLLIAPVTILVANQLEVDPIPFLIAEALSSNIGGTATLIGDPPNIMIASRAELSFNQFLFNLAPVVIVILVVFLATIRFVWGKNLRARPEMKARLMAMDESEAITDRVLLIKSLIVLAVVMAGFGLHELLHFPPSTVALFGAATLMLISMREPHRVLHEVEWTTLFFFIGLFIVVGGLVKVGAIALMAKKVLKFTAGNLFATSMFMMWFSALASAIVDNIPYVATMNPLIIDMAKELWPGQTGHQLLHHVDLLPVWWSLALGACLGGNGSAIGASANVIVCGFAERAGYPISFRRFTKYGFPLMVESVIVATVYVWWRYY